MLPSPSRNPGQCRTKAAILLVTGESGGIPHSHAHKLLSESNPSSGSNRRLRRHHNPKRTFIGTYRVFAASAVLTVSWTLSSRVKKCFAEPMASFCVPVCSCCFLSLSSLLLHLLLHSCPPPTHVHPTPGSSPPPNKNTAAPLHMAKA